MGRLIYDSAFEVDFDDRLLAHLQIVIATRLSRDQGFFLSWRDGRALGGGRTTLWLHPAIPVRLQFHEPRRHPVDPEAVRRLLADSYAAQGLRLGGDAGADEPLGTSPAPGRAQNSV